jgi:glycosyltransferase involved in cell wall biosynthesis
MNVLYISYDGILEPLGESQVLQYLFKLAPLHQITLLSFEKASDWLKREHRKNISRQINKAGIRWVPLRYHKYPLFFSTFYDLVIGFLVVFYLKIRYRISIVHARSYVSALLAVSLKTIFGIRFIFDMRGFWADEKVDAGVWLKGALIYKITKRLEVLYFRKADCLISLTNAGVNELLKFPCFNKNRTVIKVIPTCVNMQLFKPSEVVSNNDSKTFILGYTGTVTGWYLFDPVLDCFKLLSRIIPKVSLSIFNKNEHVYIRNAFERLGITDEFYTLDSAEYSQMPENINKFDAGIFFIKPVFSKLASTPTKLGEFLACGIPCLTNSGVGDMQSILEGEGVGVVLTDFSLRSKEAAVKQLLALCADKSIRQRCVSTAKKYFSLDMGVNAYNQLYLNK